MAENDGEFTMPGFGGFYKEMQEAAEKGVEQAKADEEAGDDRSWVDKVIDDAKADAEAGDDRSWVDKAIDDARADVEAGDDRSWVDKAIDDAKAQFDREATGGAPSAPAEPAAPDGGMFPKNITDLLSKPPPPTAEQVAEGGKEAADAAGKALGQVGDQISQIPVVGDVLGPVIGGAGDATRSAVAQTRDRDHDGLTDAAEIARGTNPLARDTDTDGLADELEIQIGFDPRSRDTDRDGLDDFSEAAGKVTFDLDGNMVATPDAASATLPGGAGGIMGGPPTPEARDAIQKMLTKARKPTAAPDAPHTTSPDASPPVAGGDADGVRAFLDHALGQVGDKYQFGAEVGDEDSDPSAWDSGELVEWAAKQAGVENMPDGTWRQYRAVHEQGTDLDPADALRVPGALLFSFSSDPLKQGSIPDQRQVAISLGDGHVLEVSPTGGVRVVEATASQFTHAGTISGFPAGADQQTTELVDGKLSELGIEPGSFAGGPGPVRPGGEPGDDSQPTSPVSKPSPTGTVADGVDLAKRAEDARDKSADLRTRADAAQGRARDLEADADAKRIEADAKATAALAARDAGDADGATAMQADAQQLRSDADNLDVQLERMNTEIGKIRQEANELDASAGKLDRDANEIISQLVAQPQRSVTDVAGNASENRRLEEEFENIAESRRVAAGEADARADAATARIEAEQNRITDIDGRLVQAEARAKEYEARARAAEDEAEQLTASGDPGAAAASARANQLLVEQFAQDGEVSRLQARRTAAEQTIAAQTEEVSDYEEIAGDLRANAQWADQAAQTHRDAVDKLDDGTADVVGDTPMATPAQADDPILGDPPGDDDDQGTGIGRDADVDTDAKVDTDAGTGAGLDDTEPDPGAVVQQQIAAIDESTSSLMVDDDQGGVDTSDSVDTTDSADTFDDDLDTTV